MFALQDVSKPRENQRNNISPVMYVVTFAEFCVAFYLPVRTTTSGEGRPHRRIQWTIETEAVANDVGWCTGAQTRTLGFQSDTLEGKLSPELGTSSSDPKKYLMNNTAEGSARRAAVSARV
jgi:hypothetical protein